MEHYSIVCRYLHFSQRLALFPQSGSCQQQYAGTKKNYNYLRIIFKLKVILYGVSPENPTIHLTMAIQYVKLKGDVYLWEK